jgi:hypothetical protein
MQCASCQSPLFGSYGQPPASPSRVWIVLVVLIAVGIVASIAVGGVVLFTRSRPAPVAVAAPARSAAPVVAAPASPPLAAKNPFASGQSWTGTYTCAQGDTELTIEITKVDALRVSAIFEFLHDASGASGSYELEGAFEPVARRLSLRPGKWVKQPKGYASVGLTGTVAGDLYQGNIDYSGCGAFSVRLKP